jgi:hypothetical protein
MNKMPGNQNGSALLTLIVLAAIVYGVFIGIQYVPLKIESDSVDSILESIDTGHRTTPLTSARAVNNRISNLLNINQLDDMKESFDVSQNGASFTIRVNYERDLNLIYQNKVIQYEKSLTLR